MSAFRYNTDMKIMFLIYSYTAGGGIETLLRDLCREMVSQNHDVYLCVINHDYSQAMLDSLDPRVHRILLNRTPGSGSQFSYMHRFAKIVKKEEIQILHCQGMNCVLFSLPAKMNNPGLVVLNTVHDSGDYPSYPKWKILASNRILNMTIAISHSVEGEILSRGLSPDKVITLYNVIDTPKFQYLPTKKKESPKRAIEIGNVARLFPAKKGQDVLVHAIEQLLPSYPTLHCTFAGGLFKGQAAAMDAIQAEILEKHLEEHFSFPGNLPSDQIPGFLRGLDVFVLPSNYEGFGIALIEALSCGIPCVASDLAGPREIFDLARTDGVSIGVLCRPGDPTSFASGIRELLTHSGEYDPAAMSTFVKRHFSLETSVQKHLSLYRKLLG